MTLRPNYVVEDVCLNSPRLEMRLAKFLQSKSEHPGESILGTTNNRGQAKAVYNMLSNDKFDIDEIKNAYARQTAVRISNEQTVLLIQDTTTNNLNTHKKTEGLGWCDEFNKGAMVHTCLAVTITGVPLGILSQTITTRPQNKDNSATKEEKKSRPIEEKESCRWLETMTAANSFIQQNANIIHICDREGDFYEFNTHALKNGGKFIVRIVHNRVIQEHTKVFDFIRQQPSQGILEISVPRDTGNGEKARIAQLEVRFMQVSFKKPKNRREAHLPEEISATVVHVAGREPLNKAGPIEWFLLTTEEVRHFTGAIRIVEYYVQRWKIERFHFILKSGCKVEQIQERTFKRQSSLIFLYSIVAVYIMYLMYLGREKPFLPCDILFDREEWPILYCAANKTKKAVNEPYTINEAIKYLGKPGGFAGAPSDGEPGAKVIWRGLNVLYTLLDYHHLFYEQYII
jgi:hypothetical protein